MFLCVGEFIKGQLEVKAELAGQQTRTRTSPAEVFHPEPKNRPFPNILRRRDHRMTSWLLSTGHHFPGGRGCQTWIVPDSSVHMYPVTWNLGGGLLLLSRRCDSRASAMNADNTTAVPIRSLRLLGDINALLNWMR